MKQFYFQPIAVFVALFLFAFTIQTNKIINCNPSTQYVWFELNSGATLNCNDYNATTQTQLSYFDHQAPSNNPLADLTNAGFRITQMEAADLFGCNNGIMVCAIGYSQSDVTTSKFDRIELPPGSGVFYWVPKSGANRPIPSCAICKN